MFDDKKFGTIFPVRHGEPSGTANERKMLDALGGSEGYRTRIESDALGNEVMCRTKNGAPQFERKLSPGVPPNESIGMDNGVVDMISASFIPSAVGNNDAGKLYATEYVASNLSETEKTPIVDVITPPKTKGKQPADGSTAKSYPLNSYSKKRASTLCPPSIFTGKTRLYVQSLYGRHESSFSPTVNFGTSTPSLTLENGVPITTNCGVYLDPLTKKHYLISVGTGSVKIYPMTTTATAEKLRVHLKGTEYSEDDKDRVEAYILSRSTPDPTNVVTVQVDPYPNSSFGYGWHFNWDGDKCDIVYVTYPNENQLESVHIRMSFHLNTNGVWGVSTSVVEGPTRWSNQRHSYVITHPNWSDLVLDKVGPMHAQPTGNAPYYVFYKRNEVQVCRFSAITGQQSKGATRTPSYLNPGAMYIKAGDAVDYRTWSEWSGTNVTLSCGSASVHCLSGAREVNVYRMTPAQMEEIGPTDIPWYRNDMPGSGTLQVPIGPGALTSGLYTVYDQFEGLITVYGAGGGGNGLTWDQTSYTFSGTPAATSFRDMTGTPATWSSYSGTEARSASTASIVVVPFYDAEAVYMLSTETRYRSESGTKIDKRGTSFYKATAIGGLFDEYPWFVLSVYGQMGIDYGTNLNTEAYTKSYDPETQVNTALVCSSGTILNVSIPYPNAFFSAGNDSSVPVMIDLRSSVRGAAFSSETSVDSGNAEVNLHNKPFTYVGWA